MTLLKSNNYRDINIALLSLESDIKNKIVDFDTSIIDKQLEEINKRIDEINVSEDSSNSSAEINDLRADIEDIDARVTNNTTEITSLEQQLSNIFLAENFVEDFNTTIDPGIYYWSDSSQNRPTNYGVLLVYRFASTSNWVYQTAYSTEGKIYFRQKINDGEWTSWRALAYEDITKTYTIPEVTTATTRYIKLGTFPWNFSETVKVVLSGANLEDTVEFNVLGGNGKNSNVCGWYTTNGGQTKSIRVVPVTPGVFSSNIEVWLQVTQFTTLTVKLTGNAKAAQYFNTNAQMNNTQTAPSNSKTTNLTMGRGFFGYNENSLNCYETTMVGLGFTANQVVSLTDFAQAVVNYTGINRGQVSFTWSDVGRAYIRATSPYNTQLEINGGTLTFHSSKLDVDSAWNTFEAEYINRLGEVYSFGIQTDVANVNEYVRKCVDTSGKVATAGTADTAKGWQVYALNDLKSLSSSNFYPVVIDTGFNFVDVEIYSESGLGNLPYNQNRIKFTISAAGWTDTPKSLFISEYNRYEDNEVTIGCIGYCSEDAIKAVIWLRGGVNYTCYTMNCLSAPSVKTVDTALGSSIVTVGTSYSGGTNTKVSILFTPKSTMSTGVYSSNGITSPNVKASQKLIIPIGAPTTLEDGCIWIER